MNLHNTAVLTEERLNTMIEHALQRPQQPAPKGQILLFKRPVLCMSTGAFVAAAMVLLAVTLGPSPQPLPSQNNIYADMTDMMILDTLASQI